LVKLAVRLAGLAPSNRPDARPEPTPGGNPPPNSAVSESVSRASYGDVKSALRMELGLNLAWALLAAVILGSWPHFAPRVGVSRPRQFVAIAVLILVLFPVISITDDLLAAQNPAETDCCLRKDHAVSSPHSNFPPVAAPPPPAVISLAHRSLGFAASGALAAPVAEYAGRGAVQNRPPPTA